MQLGGQAAGPGGRRCGPGRTAPGSASAAWPRTRRGPRRAVRRARPLRAGSGTGRPRRSCPRRPSTAASASPRAVTASRLVCHGAGAAARPSWAARRSARSKGVGGRAGGQHGAGGQRSGGAAELHRQLEGLEPACRGGQPVEPLRRPQPERERAASAGSGSCPRTACPHAVPPGAASAAVVPFRSASSASTVFRASSIRAVSSTSWLVSEVWTACHGADAGRVQGRDLLPEVGQQRDDGVAAALGPERRCPRRRSGPPPRRKPPRRRTRPAPGRPSPAPRPSRTRRRGSPRAPHGHRSAPPPGATPTRDSAGRRRRRSGAVHWRHPGRRPVTGSPGRLFRPRPAGGCPR